MMDVMENKLILRIQGPLSQEGRVPIDLLARKLSALQDVFFNVGSALVGGGRRGTRKTEVNQACKLVFIQASQGSIDVVMEVRKPSQMLLPEFSDIGKRALSTMGNMLEAIARKDNARLEALFPAYGSRIRILKSTERLLPEEESDYFLSIRTDGSDIRLEASERNYLNALTRGEQKASPGKIAKTITGILYLIEVETGTRNIGIISNNRKIPCFYEPEYEEIIRDLIPGSIVEVDGFATLNERGEIHQIEEISDIHQVQLAPI